MSRRILCWDLIRQDFITTDISIKDLALKYKVCYGGVYNKMRDENWRQLKEDFFKKIIKEETKFVKNEIVEDYKDRVKVINKLKKVGYEAILKAEGQTFKSPSKAIESGVVAIKQAAIMEGTQKEGGEVNITFNTIKEAIENAHRNNKLRTSPVSAGELEKQSS